MGPRGPIVGAQGVVARPYAFEAAPHEQMTGADLIRLARPEPSMTGVSVKGYRNGAPRQADEIGAGHLLVRRRFEGVGAGDNALGADDRSSWPHEDGVALLEDERQGRALQKEVVEVVGGDHLAAAQDLDATVGAVAGNAAGRVQVEQDAVVGPADEAARVGHVAADIDADGAGVVDCGVNPDRAGEHPGHRRRDDALKLGGGDASHVDRAHADDEDVARDVHHLHAAGVHGPEHVDDDGVARLDQIVGPVGRPAAGEGAGEQLGAEQLDREVVGERDADLRLRERVLLHGLADRRRRGRGSGQRVAAAERDA